MMMRRKAMYAGHYYWCILVLCNIVLCSHSSHSLRHHRGHQATPFLSTGSSESGPDEAADQMQNDSSNESSSSTSNQPRTLPLLYNQQKEIYQIKKVKPGHELKLKCGLNNTYGRIIWLHNNKAIRTDNGRYAIQGPGSRALEGQLTINNVLPIDNGVWQCHETKFDGKEHLSKPILVVVLSTPRSVHMEIDGRRITPNGQIPPSNRGGDNVISYREKENVSIQCVVEGGNPPPDIYWFIGDRNKTNESRIVSDYLEDDNIYLTRSLLHIENVTRSFNNKSVACYVSHELLPSSSSSAAPLKSSQDSSSVVIAAASTSASNSYLRAQAHLNIEYTPSFILSRIPPFGYALRVGIRAALKCDVDSNPKPDPSTIYWKKDGVDLSSSRAFRQQSSNGFLNFTRLEKNDTGWYKCVAQHTFGEFSSVGYYLNVRYEPTIIHQPPQKIDATLGDKIQMRCEANGSPTPAHCWSRIGYGGTLNTVGSGQELIIPNVLYQDSGRYVCIAQNFIGLDERRAQSQDINIVVTGRPSVYPTNRTIMAFSGQPLSLSLEVCANPLPEKVLWIFGNYVLQAGYRYLNKVAQKLERTKDTPDCFIAVLSFLSVSKEDAGEYMLLAKNNKGLHDGTIFLTVKEASFSVSSSSSKTSSSRAYKISINFKLEFILILITITSIFYGLR